MEHECSKEMIDNHKDLLTRLRIAVFGNGDKGLVKRVSSLEEVMNGIEKKLTVMTVFLGILIAAQVPSILRLFGILL